MTDINFDNFKVRCSAISMVLSNSRSNPVLTEKQTERLAQLEATAELKPLTDKMQAELSELYVKKANRFDLLF